MSDDPKLSHPQEVDAYVAADEALSKESVSEEAEAKAFVRGLKRQRNDTIAREASIASAVAIALAATFWMGYGASEVTEHAAVAEITAPTSPSTDTDSDAKIGRSPIGPPAPPTIEGNLAPTVVNAAVARQGAQLRRCFEMGFERDPSASGAVTMKLLVGETGDVIGVADLGAATEARGDGDRAMVHCVARSMRALSFPPPTGGGRALVTYPIVAPR